MRSPLGHIRSGLLALLALLVFAVTGAAAAAPVELTDDLGRKLSFAAPPQRIVSLLPSLTESVCALQACGRLVGVDRYSNFPAEVQRLPQLGGMDDTPIEALLALRPDVVLVAPSTRVHERLAALGVPVLVLESRTHADVRRILLLLGELLAAAAPLPVWQQIEQGIAAAAASVPARARGQTVYYEVDAAPYAAGESSFIGETLARLGLRNIVGASLGPFPKLNPEFIVRADPAVIMLGTRGAKALADRPGWADMRALKAGRVCSFAPHESELIARPSPRMAQAARILADCLRRLDATVAVP